MTMDPSIQSVLVTGANGLLGRRFLQTWHRNLAIYAIVRSRPSNPVPEVTYIEQDLAKPLQEDQLPPSVDAVLHLAQSSQMREFPDGATDVYAVNTGSTAVLLDWAHRSSVRFFVYASTGGLYAPSAAPLAETSKIAPPEGPLSFYFKTKLCSETLVGAYKEHLHTVVLRPFFIYGPDQRSNMLIPRLIHNVRTGVPLTVAGEHGTRMNPIFVTDAVHALETCLSDSAPHLMNIGGPDTVSIQRIALEIEKLTGVTAALQFQAGDPATYVGDVSLMKRRMKKPLTTFRSGLAEMIEGLPGQPRVSSEV